MNSKLVLTCVTVFVAGALLLAGSASAQLSGIIKVSDVIEAASNQYTGGVSAARCGSNIVVGFGDAESNGPRSAAGYSVSLNNGASFTDGGVLPVSADTSGGWGPDQLGIDLGFQGSDAYPAANTPSVTCANSSLFYYASVYTGRSNPHSIRGCSGGPICSAITLSISQNGGVTWALPTLVAIASGDVHDLVFPSMAVDPSNLQRLYVAYVVSNCCGPIDWVAPCLPSYVLRLASSMDAGTTWADNVVDYACIDGDQSAERNGEIMAPSIAVGPDGKVYVAYEFIPLGSPGQVNEIRFSRSLDHGHTFSAPLHVSAALGNTRPKLAVDRTDSPHRGEIYLTWSGQPAGTYTDVLFSDSLNAGLSFSFPRLVSPAPSAGSGRFQANPVVAVDNDGQVSACYYNTPSNKPISSSTYSYNCATSFNHAATWHTRRVISSAPVGYDALTTDFLTHHDGFFTAFEVQANGQRHVVGQKSDIDFEAQENGQRHEVDQKSDID
jgi:hypothetical protein